MFRSASKSAAEGPREVGAAQQDKVVRRVGAIVTGGVPLRRRATYASSATELGSDRAVKAASRSSLRLDTPVAKETTPLGSSRSNASIRRTVTLMPFPQTSPTGMREAPRNSSKSSVGSGLDFTRAVSDGAAGRGVRARAGEGPGTPPALSRRASDGDAQVGTKALPKESADQVAIFARRHRLQLHEVKQIFKEFEQASVTRTGSILDEEEFGEVLCNVFDTKVSSSVVASAYAEAYSEKEFNMDKFLSWYVKNMFMSLSNLTGDRDRVASDSLVYSVARNYGVSTLEIDRIKRTFDTFDTNASGDIDFKEFKEMLAVLMKTETKSLIEDRSRKFWQEVDKNESGNVGFRDYADWYLKYFSTAHGDESSSMASVESFYNSFSPVVQRRRGVEDFLRRSSTGSESTFCD